MKKLLLVLSFLIFIFTFEISAQSTTDSLVRLSDLRFHSEFEKEALRNFIKSNKDTFDLFLAIDETMSFKDAIWRKNMFMSIFDDLEQKNIYGKSINKKTLVGIINI